MRQTNNKITTKESVMAKTKTETTKPTKKIPYAFGMSLVEAGRISMDDLNEMISNEEVANPNGGNRGDGQRAMMGSDKSTHIFPTLYFKGVGKLAYTTKMKELRRKFNELKNEYTSSPSELAGAKV